MNKIWAVIICSVILAADSSLADDGYFGGSGETVYPENTTRIRMDWERVRLKKRPNPQKGKPELIFAECEFHFTNLGGPETVTMGFPAEDSEDSDYKPTLIKSFTVAADGKPVHCQRKGVERADHREDPDLRLRFDYAYVWKVPFAAHRSVSIRNTYHFEISGGQDVKVLGPYVPPFLANEFEESEFSYILKTGALWSGPIGRADITVDLGESIPPEFMETGPGGYAYREGVFTWSFKDLKPSDDIHIVIHPGPLKPLHCELTFEGMRKILDMGAVTPKNKDAKVDEALRKLDALKAEVGTDGKKYSRKNLGQDLYVLQRFRDCLLWYKELSFDSLEIDTRAEKGEKNN